MKMLKRLYVTMILVLLLAPLTVVFGVSLNERQSLRFPPEGLSLRWYGELFLQGEWLGPLKNSLIIASLGSMIAVAIAFPLALHLWSRGTWLSRVFYALGVAPFMLPPVITALGFLVFWISAGFYGHIAATVISHGIFTVALPLVTISLGLAAIDRQLIDAAQTMGATRSVVFRTILLPLVRPYVISGFAFAFVISLNEYIIAYMVAGFTAETLPIKIFNSLRYGYTPVMAVVSVLFVAIAALIFGLVGRYGDLPRLLGAERVNQ